MLPGIGALRVIVAREYPRYVLPEEVIPGVPWPPGFRDEINAWSREFLGSASLIPPGTLYLIGGNGHVTMVNPAEAAKLMNIAP